MPLNQNDLKFLKRRKYHELSSQKSQNKLQFDLKQKKFYQTKEEQLKLTVSDLKFEEIPKNASNQEQIISNYYFDFEAAELESSGKSEGSWNYFSFSEIN